MTVVYISWVKLQKAKMFLYHTGRSVMFTVITNIYNKKTKGSTLMGLFTATRKLEVFFFTTRDVRCVHHGSNTRQHVDACVWQQLEYHIDVCRVNRGAHIEHL